MPTNLSLQTRRKSHSPYQIIHNVFAGNKYCYHPPSFLILFLFNHIMCSPRAEIIFLFFGFPIAPAQKKKKQKFGENRPELAQGHYVQWHRPCTAQTPSNDTNIFPCHVDGALWSCANRLLGQSPVPSLPSFVTLRKLPPESQFLPLLGKEYR